MHNIDIQMQQPLKILLSCPRLPHATALWLKSSLRILTRVQVDDSNRMLRAGKQHVCCRYICLMDLTYDDISQHNHLRETIFLGYDAPTLDREFGKFHQRFLIDGI